MFRCSGQSVIPVDRRGIYSQCCSRKVSLCNLLGIIITLSLIDSSYAAGSLGNGVVVNSFGESSSKESGWKPIANHIFSNRQHQSSPDRELSEIIAKQRAWKQSFQPPAPPPQSLNAKPNVLGAPTPVAPIPIPSASSSLPSTRPRPVFPKRNELENQSFRQRPQVHHQPRRNQAKPSLNNNNNRRRQNNRKIIPSLFLQKVARKVFFPDRRLDSKKERLRGPGPKLRFENSGSSSNNNNKKVMFPVRKAPIQNSITNRLRQYLQPVICAFRTETVGLEGEQCVQV